jgi:hypothetical protein
MLRMDSFIRESGEILPRVERLVGQALRVLQASLHEEREGREGFGLFVSFALSW